MGAIRTANGELHLPKHMAEEILAAVERGEDISIPFIEPTQGRKMWELVPFRQPQKVS
jgi:hypothetical protein